MTIDTSKIDIKTNEFEFFLERGKLNISASKIDADGIQRLVKILNVWADIINLANEAEEVSS